MDAYAISAFIDDELQLDEKIDFVRAVHEDPDFRDEALALLHQETRLRSPDGLPLPPPVKVAPPSGEWLRWLKPMGLFAGGLVTALVLIGLVWGIGGVSNPQQLHRFVVYQPDAHQASIAGDFTHWRALTMRPVGHSGYWEIVLPLAPGEHRYSFLMDDRPPMADPTSTEREKDDFGGQNSIILVSAATKA